MSRKRLHNNLTPPVPHMSTNDARDCVKVLRAREESDEFNKCNPNLKLCIKESFYRDAKISVKDYCRKKMYDYYNTEMTEGNKPKPSYGQYLRAMQILDRYLALTTESRLKSFTEKGMLEAKQLANVNMLSKGALYLSCAIHNQSSVSVFLYDYCPYRPSSKMTRDVAIASKEILRVLDFRLHFPGAEELKDLYVKILNPDAENAVNKVSKWLLFVSLTDKYFPAFSSSKLAAATVFASIKSLNPDAKYTNAMKRAFGYSEVDLEPVAKELISATSRLRCRTAFDISISVPKGRGLPQYKPREALQPIQQET